MIRQIKQKFNEEKKYKIILIAVSAILGLVLYFCNFLISPKYINTFGLCNNNMLCEFFWSRGVAWPLHDSLFNVIISLVILILFSKTLVKFWLKIMIPFSLFAIYTIVTTKDWCGGGMICFDRTIVAAGFGKWFLILTILIVTVKSIYDFYKNNK